METETAHGNLPLDMATRFIPTVGPMLLISMGYIDPGKWSAVVEGGARYGHDLVLLMLLFNCAAILYQYLAARIGVFAKKNLAQICSEEYSKSTCIILAIQAEISVVILDLTTVLGIAHGINLLLGLDLFTCLIFTAADVFLFPLFTSLLEKCKADIIFVSMGGFVLASYVFGILLSQPETPVVTSEMFTMFSGKSAFTLMSLLGANITPHNFYIHSSLIQQQKGPANASKGALCHDHFIAIICVFSGIYLVNFVLMNSAATVFHSAGVIVLTFQDIIILMDEVFGSPIALFVLFLVILISSHITVLTWSLGGQVALHELLRMDAPVWLHRAAIRVLVIFLCLYSTWNSGAEQIYQLLVFTQVMQAMLLPSSVIPLIRVASSVSVMDVHRISYYLELVAWLVLIGIFALNYIFVFDMLFGYSEWVGDFWLNMESSMSLPYTVLLITAFAAFISMIWLATTPLKSATIRADTRVWNWEVQRRPLIHTTQEEKDADDSTYQEDEPVRTELVVEDFVDTLSDNPVFESDFELSDTNRNSDQVFHLPPVEEKLTCPGSMTPQLEVTPTIELVPEGLVEKEAPDTAFPKNDTSLESVVTVEQTVDVEVDSQIDKDEDHGDVWEPEESYREASGLTSTSEGPGSFRSLSGKSDEGGNGPGSLSRLCGLGRGARRQLAAILDEFWGQLYDFHGQATKEAKAKHLDILLGFDPKPTVSLKLNPAINASSGYFSSVTERGPALPFMSNMYDSPKQQRTLSSMESSPSGFQTGSSLWSTDMPYMDGYARNSSCSSQDPGERRYSSLRLPPTSEGRDFQPAMVHGYQLASYLSRISTDKSSDPLNTLMDPLNPKSPSFVPASYRDPLTYALGQNSQNRVSTINTSSMHNPVISRTSRLQTDKPYYDPTSYGPVGNVRSPAPVKQYHSLPGKTGLAGRDSQLADRSSRWNGPPGFEPTVSKMTYERTTPLNAGSRAGAPLAYDDLASSNKYKDAFSMQPSMYQDTKSLWSRQPFEQLYGTTGKYDGLGDETESKPSLVLPRSNSRADSETELLKSFRYCIMKLLKLEGCEWLFKQNGGLDEDLIDQVAEKLRYEAEARDINQVGQVGDSQFLSSDRKYGSASKIQDADLVKFMVSSVSYCGEGCIWRADLIVSFGVWCIHRILELSLMESRPELWGKYTYVLNRLQGVLDPAFSKPRSPLPPCFCLQMPVTNLRKSSPPTPNAPLPPAAKPGKGKCMTASTVLEMVRDVEIALSCRKGRAGTTSGDVAFPKGKENLASVLKRYKRRLSNKPVGTHDSGPGSGSRKIQQVAYVS